METKDFAKEDDLRLPGGYVGSIYLPEELARARSLYYDDNSEMYRECLQLARSSNSSAAAVIAMMHYNKIFGRHSSDDLAEEWARNSAEAGNAYGMYVCGLIGLDNRDCRLAIQLLQKSAELRFGPAAWVLGKLYEIGICADQSDSRALGFYKSSARAGYVFGYPSLVDLLATGRIGRGKAILGWAGRILILPFLTMKRIGLSRISEQALIPARFVSMISRSSVRQEPGPN